MKKIMVYILGAASWLFQLSCYATEKFEVLPDLPDPLAYAMQPVEASTISGSADPASLITNSQSIGTEPSMVSVVFSLAIVILLIYLTGIIYSKLNKVGAKTLRKHQGNLSNSHVSVLSTTQLGNNKTLHVVELDGKRMLIGASSGAIHLIKDLGSYNNGIEEEFSHIEIPNIKIPKIEIPKIEIPTIGLSKLMTKTHKAMESIIEEDNKNDILNKDNSKNEDYKTKVESNDELSHEGIIDSLFSQEVDVQSDVVDSDKNVTEHIVDPEDFVLYKKYLS